MNLPDLILSVFIIVFSAVILFISAFRKYTFFEKITEWTIVSLGLIFHFGALYGIFYFLVTGVNVKGFLQILSILLLLLLPITGILSMQKISKIKSFVLNLIK
jgi:hypothetical protein